MERGSFDISTVTGLTDAAVPDIPPNRPIEFPEEDPRHRLTIVPGRIIPPSPPARWGAPALVTLCALAVHGGFAALLLLLLDWRDFTSPTETAIPVAIVASIPRAPKLPSTVSSPRPVPLPPPPSPPTSEAGAPPPLIAPPPEPSPAAIAEAAPPPRTEPPPQPAPLEPATAPTRPAAAPEVVSAPQGGFVVSPPAPPPGTEPAIPRTLGRTKASAQLVEALPMDLSALPSTFLAVLSGSGTQAGNEYKGLVYGRIQRSHRAMEEAAARHLRGQVIVAFSVDPGGRAGDLRIEKSSGNPAVDALGLEMVREAEPFPPPPPGARQVFTPAFAFGGQE